MNSEKGSRPETAGESILSFRDVYAGYDRTPVLRGLSVEVPSHCVCGIIGPNGSGKTTMLHAAAGFIRTMKGQILFEGKEITSVSPDRRCRMGIGRTFQIPRHFPRLSLYESTLAAAIFGAGLGERDGREKAIESLELTGLAPKREKLAGDLTLLELKKLEVARAIATNPRLLLLDEAAAGLTSLEVEELIRLILRLKRAGQTIVWIEHMVDAIVHTADLMICMAEGKCIASGNPADVIRSREVETLYLGVREDD